MTYTLTQERAIQAATVVAERLGMVPIEPVILKDSNNTSIHLAPFPVIARVCTTAFVHSVNSKLEREVEVAQHLARAGAPIVSPTTNPPAGPNYYAGTGLTLWQLVDHRLALESNSADAAEALHKVHDALANFTGTLPSFTAAIDICRDLLEDKSALPALAPADRVFLIEEHDRLRRSLASFSFVPIALHGDAHLGNVLVTPDGVSVDGLGVGMLWASRMGPNESPRHCTCSLSGGKS